MKSKFAKTISQGLAFVFAAALLASCDSTLFVRPGTHLLRTAPQFEGNDGLSDGALGSAIRSKPNSAILGRKYKVYLYNLGGLIAIDSSPSKRFLHRKFDKDTIVENSVVRWLQERVGEPPILVEDLPLDKDEENLEGLYFSEGFLEAQVAHRTVVGKGRNSLKAEVIFDIDEGPPFLLQTIVYSGKDSTMRRLVEATHEESLLKSGNRYQQRNIAEERVRIANVLRDSGYFRMGPEQISYIADTTINPSRLPNYRALIDTLEPGDSLPHVASEIPRPTQKRMDLEVVLPDTVEQYTIGTVNIRMRRTDDPANQDAIGFDLQRLSPNVQKLYRINAKWLRPEHDFKVITLPDVARKVSLSTLARRVSIFPGQLYSQALQRRTVQQMNNLAMFRSVNVNYVVADSLANRLDTYIDLVLLRRYDMRVGAEFFTTQDRTVRSNYPGFGLTLNVTNRNLFGNGERLEFQGGGNVSLYRAADGTEQPFYSINARLNFTIPSFLLVERPNRNLLRFRPNTTFGVGVLLESRREYDRTSYNFDWSYTWFNTPYSNRGQFTLTPLSLLLVQTDRKPEFNEFLQGFGEDQAGIVEFIERDLRSRFLSRTALTYTFNNEYGVIRTRASWFIRPSFEIGGLIPYLIDATSGEATTDTLVRIGSNLQYGTYLRGSMDARVHLPVGTESAVVGRLFAGYAYGIGGSPFVPFESRFYTGGVSSVRGWLSNALGPGSVPQLATSVSNVVAIGGEIGFEANAEYRFPMFSILEGAFFADAGNVWFNSQNTSTNPRGGLSWNNLELGLAAGYGVRLDLTFLVVRLDLGQQLYAPDLKGWVVKQWPRDIGGSRLQFNFGIGYPF